MSTINADFAIKATEFGLTGQQIVVLYALAEEEKNRAVEEKECQISDFKCSQHGKITPRPICPKCLPDTTS